MDVIDGASLIDMGYRLSFERACAAPAQDVYDLLIDVERWPDWLTAARSALWEEPGNSSTRQGAIRQIVVSGLTMREQILVADRPRHQAYTILSGIPVTNHRADVYIHDSEAGSCIVWQATFEAKVPFTGPLIWLLLRASMPKMVSALAHGAEQLSG